VNRPPLVNNPVSSASSSVSGSVSGRAPAETYQVIVLADSAETQDKVRTVAPNAILTTINGQVVMQVGVFRERQDADRLQQRLSMQGLPTSVIPVR
jgi:cell division protein FtsN